MHTKRSSSGKIGINIKNYLQDRPDGHHIVPVNQDGGNEIIFLKFILKFKRLKNQS